MGDRVINHSFHIVISTPRFIEGGEILFLEKILRQAQDDTPCQISPTIRRVHRVKMTGASKRVLSTPCIFFQYIVWFERDLE